MNKATIVLKLWRLTVPQKIETARFIVQSMTGNAFFPTPTPDLATVTASIDALEVVHIASLGGGKEERAAVLPKIQELDRNLNLLGSYVETIANATGGAEAEHIASSSGMEIKGITPRSATSFNVENGRPGEVKIATVYVNRSIFRFQMTNTPEDESTYKTIGESTRAKMTMDGLKSGTRYYFRVCTIGKDGPEPWSNPINLIVT